MADTIKLAEYLFTRLRQLGVGSVHGVPGDYNLTLLDYVEPAGLTWVGSANELNAGYAADGYSRIKGIGAIVTTFGVGELSAINAIAGAYTEYAPVVHIVGTPLRRAQDERHLIHHTFKDGEYKRFAEMAARVTCAQASLRDPRISAQQIDNTLAQCLLYSRPVYIEVPVDLVEAQLSKSRLDTPIQIPEALPHPAEDQIVSEIVEKVNASKQPIIIVDGESRPLRILDDVQQLISSSKWPTWTMSFAKGLLNETLPNFHGVYNGDFDRKDVQDFVRSADLALCFGPHRSTTNTMFNSATPKPEVAIDFTLEGIKITTGQLQRDVSSKRVLKKLLEVIDFSKLSGTKTEPQLTLEKTPAFSDFNKSDDIKQKQLWRIMEGSLRSGDIVMGETGTSGYGVREMSLPVNTRLFTHVTWLSIGYMLPAAQGAALAQRELIQADKWHGIKDARTIIFIGDGSFQMTAQEVATIVRHNLDVTIYLVNNDGYTVERCIHGRNQGYNDIARWNYLLAPAFFGAGKETFTTSVKTWGELEASLENESFANRKGLKMVEIVLDKEDASNGVLDFILKKQIEEDTKA